MHRGTVVVVWTAVVAVMAIGPFVIHAAIATGNWTFLIVAIPVSQLVVLGAVTAARKPAARRWIAAAAAVLVVAIAGARLDGVSLIGLPGIPHALAYAGLLVGFGLSLRPPRTAIITRMAQAIRGPLPPELLAYTRRVTVAWCVFFAAQLVVSLALFLWASTETWSFFVNVLNAPLVFGMFVLEYCYRLVRYRDYRHDRLSDVMRLFAKPAKNASTLVDTV